MKNIDQPLFFTFVGLLLFGLVMMSSMSVAPSYENTGQNYYYFVRHFIYIIVGIPVFLVALTIPLETVKRFSLWFYLFGIGLLLMVLLSGSSFDTTAQAWLVFFGFSFQPVELVKLAIIIFLSALFASGKYRTDTLEGGLVPFLFVLSIPAVLIMMQPDFGGLFILTLIGITIFFVAGANIKHLFVGSGFGAVGAVIILLLVDYIRERFAVLWNPDLDPYGAGFQIKQALIAIGSGELFGRGFQNSIQKFNYLPEVQSDTIFSAISEEMGFFRILVLLGAYFFIVYKSIHIAKNASDDFSRYMAVGLSTWIVGQALINIGVNLAVFPNTGITLPIISYGGTSLIMTMIAMGLLLNISAQTSVTPKRRYY